MALFGALLFAVHPVQTEAVTYIITRTELLATFFYLATFLLFIKGATSGKASYYVGAVLTSILAMGSKEWAVTLPALLILYDYLFIAEGKVSTVVSRWMFYLAIALTCTIVLRHLDLFAAKGSGAGIGFNVSTTSGITANTFWLTSSTLSGPTSGFCSCRSTRTLIMTIPLQKHCSSYRHSSH